MDTMTDKFDEDLFMQIAEEKHKKACEDWDKLEKERLNKIFAALGSVETDFPATLRRAETLEKVRSGVESGDRRAMLELLGILIDSLRAFDILPRESRLALADGLEKMLGNLAEAKGFLPRGRGGKQAPAKRVSATAIQVEMYRFKLGISLEEAEANVADEYDMKQDLVHKYWKRSHPEAKNVINILRLFGGGTPFFRKKKVR